MYSPGNYHLLNLSSQKTNLLQRVWFQFELAHSCIACDKFCDWEKRGGFYSIFKRLGVGEEGRIGGSNRVNKQKQLINPLGTCKISA